MNRDNLGHFVDRLMVSLVIAMLAIGVYFLLSSIMIAIIRSPR